MDVDQSAASKGQDRFSPYAAMGDEPAGQVDPGGMRFQSRDIIPFAPPPNFGGFLPSSLAFMGIGPNGIDLDGSGQDMDEDWDIGANGEISGTFSDDMADMFSQTYGSDDGDRDAHGPNENFNGKWYKGGKGDERKGNDNDQSDYEKYNDPNRNPKQDTPLTDGEIDKLKREKRWDHHDKDFGGKEDLYKDKKGNVYAKPKGGRGYGEPIGINMKNLSIGVEVGIGAAIGIGIYEGIKWIGAVILAPETGGASLAGAAVLP